MSPWPGEILFDVAPVRRLSSFGGPAVPHPRDPWLCVPRSLGVCPIERRSSPKNRLSDLRRLSAALAYRASKVPRGPLDRHAGHPAQNHQKSAGFQGSDSPCRLAARLDGRAGTDSSLTPVCKSADTRSHARAEAPEWRGLHLHLQWPTTIPSLTCFRALPPLAVRGLRTLGYHSLRARAHCSMKTPTGSSDGDAIGTAHGNHPHCG